MYHSHSHQEKAFDFFASFLRNVLSGDERYKPLIEPVISDVKSLTRKEKDYFDVNRSSYDVIVFLAEKDPTFFKDLDISNLSEEQYHHILKLVTAQRELFLA